MALATNAKSRIHFEKNNKQYHRKDHDFYVNGDTFGVIIIHGHATVCFFFN